MQQGQDLFFGMAGNSREKRQVCVCVCVGVCFKK